MRLSFFVTLPLAMFVIGQQVSAQSQIAENEKAVVAFDLRLDKLRNNDLVQGSGIEENIMQEMQGEIGSFPVQSIDRIFGLVGAPESLEGFADLQDGGDLPLDFYVQVRFVDQDAAELMLDRIKEDSETVEKDGKTYYKPPEGKGPRNIAVHSLNATTVEIGTEKYLFAKSRRQLFTESLNGSWAAMPNEAIRLAIDVESARKIVDEAVEMGKENLPQEAEMFLHLGSTVSALRLSIDLDSDNLITFVATGTDEAGAEKLQEGLEAVLGLARFGGKKMVDQLEKEDPDMGKVASKIMTSLKTLKEGNNIEITIPKPDGFNDAVKNMLELVQGRAKEVNAMNNYRQYALAVHNFHDAYRQFPIAAPRGSEQSEEISWHVRVLPFMEEAGISEKMDLKEPHDGETNKQFADQMPQVYGPDGKTTQACWIIPAELPTTFASIKDGTSNTIMIMQNPTAVPWMEPKDLTPEEAVEIVTGLMDGQELIVAFYDGSVRTLSNKVDEETLKKLFDPNDGMPVELE